MGILDMFMGAGKSTFSRLDELRTLGDAGLVARGRESAFLKTIPFEVLGRAKSKAEQQSIIKATTPLFRFQAARDTDVLKGMRIAAQAEVFAPVNLESLTPWLVKMYLVAKKIADDLAKRGSKAGGKK